MRNRVSTVAKVLVAAVVVGLGCTVGALPAAAHNSLAGSSPKNDSTVARVPGSVTLTFLSSVNQATLRIDVTTPAGTEGDVEATVSGRIVTVPLDSGPAGKYSVAYQLGSSDGHPVKGSVSFTAETGETPSASPTPSRPEASPSVTPVARVAPPEDTPRWPYMLGMLLLAAVGGAVVARLVHRARKRNA